MGGAPYDQKVCVIPITCANTPPTGLGCAGDECWNPAATDESHPSCNPVADRVAFDREQYVTLEAGVVAPRDICTVDLDTDTLTLSNEKCYVNDDDPLDLYDETGPSWAPSGAQITYASNMPPGGPDYELWTRNSTNPGPLNIPTQLTDNSATEVDDEPDWAPLALP